VLRPALALAAQLLRRPAVRAAAALLLLLGALGGLLPLLDVPGFELGEVGAWLGLALAPPLGWWAASAERARHRSSPAVAALAAALASTALLALLFLAVTVRAALGPCRALDGAAFFPVLALPSAWLAAALSVALAWTGRRARLAAGLALALLGSAGWTLLEAWRGPAAFALDHLLGVWPGPLYDEALRLDARLLLFRAGTVALAVAVGAGATLAAAFRHDARRARGAALALGLALAAFTGLRVQLRARVLDGDRAAIAAALGGWSDGAACTLIFPAELKAPARAALAADCEFHAADLAAALGLASPPRVTVFIHRSDEEKRRHVGAGATNFTKPWLREIHLTQAGFPHPVLRHELVHAVAAALDPGPLGVPARAGVLVSAGLVEGLAVALELPRGSWTVHEWSAALGDLGMIPDVAGQLGPAGFWSTAPARAYTAAGSLVAFLLERHGSAAVARLYRSGDFEAATGRPLAALVADWRAFLAALPRPPGLAAAARARFARPALFAVPCAREVAALEERAWFEAGHGRVAAACAQLRRVAALTGRVGPLKSAGDLLARSGALDEAGAAYQEAARVAGDADPALSAALASARADLAWRRDQPDAAAAGWLAALDAGGERHERRLLEAKLAALSDPELARLARPWLLGQADTAAALPGLERLERPLSDYLAARAHLARGEVAEALPLLQRAAASPLPALLRQETRALLAETRCLAGATTDGAGEWAALAAEATGGADRVRAEAGIRRCAFEAARR
jgi:hypothetical protein